MAQEELARETRKHRYPLRDLKADFPAFVRRLRGYEMGENLPKGWIPSSHYWLVSGRQFIGEVRIRHKLNKVLRGMGGHIGYEIRPTKRKKGYGKKILTSALKKAKALGIKNALLTCDDKNVGSYKIIEKNGGVLQGKMRYQGAMRRYYRIKIK